MEMLVIRTLIKFGAVCLGVYHVFDQINNGIAKLCYKVVSPCFIEVELDAHPYGFWVVIGIYIIISLAFFMSLINEAREFRKLMGKK